MKSWISCKEKMPPIAIRPDYSDPDMEYTWTKTVQIMLNPSDVRSLELFTDYFAGAYYDYGDDRWHWSDYSGGPSSDVLFWRHPE